MTFETNTSRSRMEIEKNKSRKKLVDLESGSGSGLKRRRKKIEMTLRLMRRKRLNCAKGLNPKRKYRTDIREAGKSQPAMPRVRYSFEVRCLPRILFKARLTRIPHKPMNSRIPKTIRH